MWLWILSALVVALAWAGWFVLRPDPRVADQPGADIFPLWIPIFVTLAAVLVIVGVYVFRRVRARPRCAPCARSVRQ